ncbi:MAG: Ribose-5-phosphate isomerase A [Chlamydiales bacterium]|nr:Ribose-5-phosphate isomerase A [Chlamydiales bacterium]MCH9634906.1 Ribose-5-phosphate isomerase A [Chlamydiales bacterium]MCH9704118.1 ribose-5-phosphate isomerase RpiA [Chlamydiota bacterium]
MKLSPDKQDEIKKALGEKAASLVENGQLVGLGTGTTATHFINSLIKRCQEGLNIRCVCSSIESQNQAKAGGIEVLDINSVDTVDLTIDGADEVDPQNRMIKGGGGAHVREKIVASASRQLLIMVDESKLVDCLGTFGLPIEILPFGLKSTLHKLNQMGYEGKLRENFVSDNGNVIFDVHTPACFKNPEVDHAKILAIPGVVESGFFLDFPVRVLVGYADGRVEFR